MKRILIAPDKFKGTLSAGEICTILKDELLKSNANLEIECCPLADGGDGSVEILSAYMDLTRVDCKTVDPIGKPINASYYVSNETAYIELASASGLVLLDETDRNPMNTSTYGTGLLIKDAVNNGIKNIFLFLGGSSTNDGGIGIANALGVQFLDKSGLALEPIGKSLLDIHTIKYSDDYNGVNIQLCCDVTNVPYGDNGAAKIYGKQKGASPSEIQLLDNGIKNLCNRVREKTGKELETLIGGGSAGAIAVSGVGLLDGSIISGIEYITKVIDLRSKVKNADLVITGEGRLDDQSMNGKVVKGVSDLCKEFDKQLYAVAGQNTLEEEELKGLGIEDVFTIIELADDIDDAMDNSRAYMMKIGRMMSGAV